MNKSHELKTLEKISISIEGGGKPTMKYRMARRALSIVGYAALAYVFLSVKNGHLDNVVGLIIFFIIAFIEGALFIYTMLEANDEIIVPYFDVKKIKARIDELNT